MVCATFVRYVRLKLWGTSFPVSVSVSVSVQLQPIVSGIGYRSPAWYRSNPSHSAFSATFTYLKQQYNDIIHYLYCEHCEIYYEAIFAIAIDVTCRKCPNFSSYLLIFHDLHLIPGLSMPGKCEVTIP